MTFSVLVFLAIVIIVFDLSNRVPGDDQAATPAEPRVPGQKMGPPPWWVFLLMRVAIALSMLVFAQIFPD